MVQVNDRVTGSTQDGEARIGTVSEIKDGVAYITWDTGHVKGAVFISALNDEDDEHNERDRRTIRVIYPRSSFPPC